MDNRTRPDNSAAGRKNDRNRLALKETKQRPAKAVDTGNFRIFKKIEERIVNIPLIARPHDYTIERIRMDRYVDEPPAAVRYEGETMIITVVEEEFEVVKRLKIVEELRLTPNVIDSVTHQQVRLRRERIDVIKDPPGNCE